jgi:hypothetical protein
MRTSQEPARSRKFVTAGWPAQGPNSSHANNQHTSPDMLFYGPKDAFAWVGNTFGNNSDFSKITAEVDGPSLESQKASSAATHPLDRKTATHWSDLMSYQQAIDSETHHIQHLPLDRLLTDTMVAQIVAQNQYVTLTLEIVAFAVQNSGVLVGVGQTGTPAELHTLAGYDMGNAIANPKKLYDGGAVLLTGTDSVGNIGAVDHPFGISLHHEIGYLVA